MKITINLDSTKMTQETMNKVWRNVYDSLVMHNAFDIEGEITTED